MMPRASMNALVSGSADAMVHLQARQHCVRPTSTGINTLQTCKDHIKRLRKDLESGMSFSALQASIHMQAIQHRTDTKLYRIQTPQTPIVRTKRYKEYHMDEFPGGTNMIVAVLAYTGCTSA